MSASLENLPLQDPNIDRLNGQDQDPFRSTPKAQQPHPHRFSAFDTQLFVLNHPSSSPSQAKRALEAHLAETERRLQETSRLGTALVQQRKRLSERLLEVEAQQNDGEIGPELRQKLIDVEKEYNEVGRASARVFLGPKTDGAVPRDSMNSPFALDGKVSHQSLCILLCLTRNLQRASSPSKFTSEASDSPSKLNVPRKLRNQPSNQVGNIEFAVEINTSLIAQVRQLQAVVSERDEALKAANLERSRLEAEAEGFAQRFKSMDESEQRYKDENWNLETQTHEMIAAAKEATSREQKLQQLLAATTAEKSAADRELDELKQNHGRLIEDITLVRKNHDVELAALRKNLNQGETETSALKRKVEELTTQNQELAKAITSRFRDAEAEAGKDADPEPEDLSRDMSDPELSPPPSPTKGVPRHTMLESETLKSSLHHAHRMIQNLKGNIHREKTEKSDLKRMLQEARDELEVRRKEPGGMNSESKKSRFKPQQEFNKKIRSSMLGAGRESKIHIMADDAEWEEHDGQPSSYRDQAATAQKPDNGTELGRMTDMSDAYQTANETEDAFETANEQESATENESYQPGVRGSPVDSNDELTETEAGPARGRVTRGERPSLLISGKAADRLSYQSTASTSGDDEQSSKTPAVQPQKYRLKIHRGPRRSRIGSDTMESSTPPSAKNSPASFIGSGGQEGQSLFAELGGLNGGESGEDLDGTPTKGRTPMNGSMPSLNSNLGREKSTSSLASSDKSTPSIMIPPSNLETPPLPRRQQVDSSTMTDPWEPVQSHLGQTTAANTRSNELVNDDPFISKSVSADPGVRSLQDSDPAESSASTSSWPKMLDQPLGTLSSMIFNIGNTSESTPATRKEGPRNVHTTPDQFEKGVYDNQISQPLSENEQHLESFNTTNPRPLVNNSTSPATIQPILSISSVQSIEIAPAVTSDVTHDLRTWTPSVLPLAKTSDANPNVAGKPNVERIINTIFGSAPETNPSASYLGDTGAGRAVPELPQRDARRPVSESAFNLGGQPKGGVNPESAKSIPGDVADQSSQTLLSSDQIDRILLLNDKALTLNSHKAAGPPMIIPVADVEAAPLPVSSQRPLDSKDTGKGKQVELPNRDSVPSVRVPRRPLSSASMRSRNGQYPPLPPDHQQAIAAATQKAPSSLEPPTGSMGPPLVPASAYRTGVMRPRTPSRSRTPSQQPIQSPASKNGTASRVRHSTSKSQMSRRSSVSSFASELDERFNIRVDNIPGPYGIQSGTDPRMIQAITQTMIGEYLWKYTRKAGRGDMSSNRHRRFFWVHPYTRTLYWSAKDPAIAGRAELKAKSVGIEEVQVVIDDNPMPPGLHRKSLVIYTPGRSIKLTATTGQRHETWFNALSYLLLRANPDGAPPSGADGTGISPEDIEGFNPSLSRGTSRATISRISLSSFRNASSQRSLNQRAQANPEARKPQNASVASRHSHQAGPYYGSTSSRWSQYLKHGSSVRGSMSSRTSHAVVPNEQGGSSQYANMAHDSAEDLREVIEQQEREADQLENVRACCDGS